MTLPSLKARDSWFIEFPSRGNLSPNVLVSVCPTVLSSLIKGRFPSRRLSEAEEEKWVKAVVGGFEVRQLQREIEEKEAELRVLRKKLDDKILSLKAG